MEYRIYFCLGLIHLCTAGIFYANLIMKRADIVKFSKGLYSAPSSFMYPAVSNFEKKVQEISLAYNCVQPGST